MARTDGWIPPKKTRLSVPLEEQIRFRAYELYEQRGKEHGREMEDWLQAQSEVVRSASAVAGYDLQSLWHAAL
jgi:hypothetical protein